MGDIACVDDQLLGKGEKEESVCIVQVVHATS